MGKFVGDKEIVLTETVILGPGQSVRFTDVVAGRARINVTLQFADDEKNSDAHSEHRIAAGTLLSSDPTLEVRLLNWNSPFAQTFVSPIKAGALPDGTPLGYNVAVSMIGTAKVVLFQLYLGGKY